MRVYDKTYTDLTVWVSRAEDQGAYLFGVTFDGVDVVFNARKLGGIDSDIVQAEMEAKNTSPATAQ